VLQKKDSMESSLYRIDDNGNFARMKIFNEIFVYIGDRFILASGASLMAGKYAECLKSI
jgi:hypothetical protein